MISFLDYLYLLYLFFIHPQKTRVGGGVETGRGETGRPSTHPRILVVCARGGGVVAGL
jgi:hypothetical protein